MKGIISAFTWLIEFIKDIFSYVSMVFKMIGQAFKYIGQIITMAFNWLITFPIWLKGIIWLTLFISVMYIIIGRVGGKSD